MIFMYCSNYSVNSANWQCSQMTWAEPEWEGQGVRTPGNLKWLLVSLGIFVRTTLEKQLDHLKGGLYGPMWMA